MNDFGEDDDVFVMKRCFLRSAAGMWESYDGYVDVHVPENADDNVIFMRAVQELARTSFPDRPGLSGWRFERVETL